MLVSRVCAYTSSKSMKIEGKGKKNFTRVSTIMIRNVDRNTKVTEGGKCAFSHFNRFRFKALSRNCKNTNIIIVS